MSNKKNKNTKSINNNQIPNTITSTKTKLLPYYNNLLEIIESKKQYCKTEEEAEILNKEIEETLKRDKRTKDFIKKIKKHKDNFILPYILAELGIDYQKTSPFAILCEIVANTMLVRSNILIELIGDQGSGKSHIRQNILGIYSQTGTITSSQIFGSKVSHAKIIDSALLSQEVVFLDEFSLENNIIAEEFKKATTMNKFEQSGKFPIPTNTSFALAYNVFKDISSFRETRELMGMLQTSSDKALQDRIVARVPFYKDFLRRSYIDSSNSTLNEPLKDFLLSRRSISIQSIRTKLKFYIEDSRDLNAITNVAEAILLICYLDIKQIPDYAIDASIEFAKYFRSLTKTNRDQFYNPLTPKSFFFLLRLRNFLKEERENIYFLYDNYDRIILYNKKENKIQKLALTEYGLHRNNIEYNKAQNGDIEYEIKKHPKDNLRIFHTIDRGFKPILNEWYYAERNKIIPPNWEANKKTQEKNQLILESSVTKIVLGIPSSITELEGLHRLIKLEITTYLLYQGFNVIEEDIPIYSIILNDKQDWKIIDVFYINS